jgi:hypothetical protein
LEFPKISRIEKIFGVGTELGLNGHVYKGRREIWYGMVSAGVRISGQGDGDWR